MTATQLFTLEPAGAFRRGPGERGASSGVLFHSDTLMAALQCTAADTGILADAALASPPRFSVSSVFFQVEGVRLYPRPLAAPARLEGSGDGGEAERLRRLWDGLELLTEARLESLALGRRVRFDAEDLIGGRAWGMPSERGLRGLPGEAHGTLEAAGRSPARGNGADGAAKLFFLARLDEPGLLAPLRELTARLGESGLGGGRSAGCGQFSLAGVHGPPAFLSATEGQEGEPESPPSLLLSLYLPTREEAGRGVLREAAAESEMRGGWIQSGGPTGLRKRPVRMLLEGSVLRSGGRPAGEVCDVRPEGFEGHPVWRDGRAFTIAYRGAS